MAKAKKTVLEELERVRYVGPARAETLYDDHKIRSIGDLVEFGDEGNLTELTGVGKKKASTILESARRLAGADGRDTEAVEEKSADEAKSTAQKKKASKQQRAAGANGRAPRPSPTAEPTRAAAAGRAGVSGTTPSMDTPTPEAQRRPAADERSLRQRFIATLRCPACGHDRFDIGASSLTCQACQRQFDFRDGVVDLAPPVPPNRSLTQKVMESRFYAQFYEDLMRPRLTSVVSSRSMREEYRLAAEFLELDEEARLLDVGCGTANFTRYFAQRLGLAEVSASNDQLPLVVGMDLSWSMLDHARRNIEQENLGDKIYLIRGDATRIPVRRGAYNRLHCGGSLHMMNDIDEGLRNFARVLEPNGICVIGTFILGKGLLRRLVKRAAEFPTRFHWFSRDELHRRVERAGFEILDDSVAGDAITVKARRI